MEKNIAILAGDGIGAEIMAQAILVLQTIEKQYGHRFHLHRSLIGGAAFDEFGEHFPEVTKQVCANADAILFGAVGGPLHLSHLPKWQNCETKSLLALRQGFAFYANLRPIRVYPSLHGISPLKASLFKSDIDILIIRDSIGGLYFGEHCLNQTAKPRSASDQAFYDENQITAVAHMAFTAAQKRNKHVVSVDKANVLATSALWRQVVSEVGTEFPDVRLEHMLVDNAAMQLILQPSHFDVVLTSNMFGDILSDLAAAIPGSLGLIPSASLNGNGLGLYEPAGGSAPDIAGKGLANPTGQILSVALMLRYSFGLEIEAKAIENAVQKTISQAIYTRDLVVSGNAVGTEQMGEAIIANLTGISAISA